MRVSVLVSAHNYGRYLPRAVGSALGQDGAAEVECVVVDDGSTDDTPEILAGLGPRVRWARQENLGQAAALNAAFALSTGDVLCLLDADDEWKPGKVRAVLEAFGRDPEAGLAYHEVDPVDGEGRALPGFLGEYPRADGDVSARMRTKVLPWMFTPTSALSLRREVARHLFPLSTALRGNADDLLAPAACLLAPVVHLEEAHSWYRVHGANLWAGRAPGALEAAGSPGAAWEDVDRLEARVREVRLLEAKVESANGALARAGLAGGLSPYLSWKYLRDRARIEGRPILSWWREVVAGAAGLGGVGATARAALALKLLRRMLKHDVRRALGRAP